MQWFLEQIMSLTFDYYKNVPPPVKKMDRIKILADFDDIEAKIKEVRSLIKLEFSNKLLLAAQYRINDANPIDYIYMSLKSTIVPLVRTSTESQTLVKFIENSGCESTVCQIFKVYREAEEKEMAKTDAETHRLLWRASSLNDVLFTLGRGELVPCAQKDLKNKPQRYRKSVDVPDDDSYVTYYEMFSDVVPNCATYSTE